MNIEISLTRKLASKLNLKLEPTKNITPSENHFYADIFHNHVFLFHTLFSWISVTTIKEMKKDPLKAIKDSVSSTLEHEEIRTYIIEEYLLDLESVSFTLTNDRSTISRMNQAKKDIDSIYENYRNVPNLLELSKIEYFNDTLLKDPNSKGYITPYIEMGYYLTNKYRSDFRDDTNRKFYFVYKQSIISNIPKVIDHSQDNIEKEFYIKYPSPSIENHYEYILSKTGLKDIVRVDYYLSLFNLSKDLYYAYIRFFGRIYKSR